MTVDDPQAWAELPNDPDAGGLSPDLNVASIEQLAAVAVPALYAADAAADPGLLQGFFSDAAAVAALRVPGKFAGSTPLSVTLQLVGPVHDHADPGAHVRVHLQVAERAADGGQQVERQFWDVAAGRTATVSRPTCPGCGAPVPAGGVTCRFCGADVRAPADVPLQVVKVQFY